MSIHERPRDPVVEERHYHSSKSWVGWLLGLAAAIALIIVLFVALDGDDDVDVPSDVDVPTDVDVPDVDVEGDVDVTDGGAE